jgi:hypothetical protein
MTATALAAWIIQLTTDPADLSSSLPARSVRISQFAWEAVLARGLFADTRLRGDSPVSLSQID